MKVLLVVLSLFAVSPSFAEDGIWFKSESQSCSSGNEVKTNYIETVRVLVSNDQKKIVRELTLTSNKVSETFKLVNVGNKDKYMAVPENLDHTDVFYIQITEDMQVTLNHSDFSQAVCGGGLVVTKLVKETSGQEFTEESPSSVAKN